jgi:hypothetical protein
LKFPGRVYNCKIFSRGYGNEIRAVPNITLFQGAFLHFFSWNFRGGYAIQRYFPGGYDNESSEIPEGGCK